MVKRFTESLDKHYCIKYRINMMENLELMKEFGIKKFQEGEEGRWHCPECGEVFYGKKLTLSIIQLK